MAATQVLGYQQIWTDGMNRGDVSVADQSFSDDCVIHVTGFPEAIRGVEAWKAAAAGFLAAFPGMKITIDEQISAGDTTVTRWHARAVHNGSFGPIPPTGRTVAFDGLILDHLVDGKVKERWEQFDQAVILQQIGVA
jgi:predicted ester cyclase